LSERTFKVGRAGSKNLALLYSARHSYLLRVILSSMHAEFWNRRTTVVAIWGLLIAGAVYVFWYEPGKTGFFPLCPFRLLTGLTCPGCGSTRAMHQLLHGHVEAAFMLNPLFLIALPFLAFALLRHTKLAFAGDLPQPNALPSRYIYLIFVVVLSFWIFRNTPFYPFVS